MKGVKIIQAGLDLDNPREFQSHQQLSNLGIRYTRIQNDPYNETPPLNNIYQGWTDFYKGPDKAPNDPGLTPRHYGAWLSHKQSIMLGFCDSGHSLICEADCKILDTDKFKLRLQEAIKVLDETDYPIIRFEKSNNLVDSKFYEQVSDNIYECDKITLGHCYLINEKSKDFWDKLYTEQGWTTPDDWLLFSFYYKNIKFLAFKEDHLTSQFDGYSEIDKVFKAY